MSFEVRDLGVCRYLEALRIQEALVAAKLQGDPRDFLLFVQHEPVFTLGRGADQRDLRGADELLGIPAYRTSRGGGVTFHGPGQLVAYPIIALYGGRRDVHDYVSRLEQVVIDYCAEVGLTASRRPGTPGVWVNDAKLASVGIAIRRWVAFHGIALNISNDLYAFDAIVPCRVAGMKVTSLARELRQAPSLAEVQARLEIHFRSRFESSRERAEVAVGQSW